MAEHPTLDELQNFLLGRLSSAGARSVVAHLIGGCSLCREALSSAPAEGAGYDEALDRAFAAYRWHGAGALEQRARTRKALSRIKAGGIEALAKAPVKLKGIAGCEALLEQSWALRHEDPGKMLELANYAAMMADRLNPERYGPRRLADMRCRAWSALGNAYRVTDDLGSAEWALGHASELYLQGTGDEALAVRLIDLQASLYGAQRRLPEALEALDGVYALHHRRGDSHLAGRALISKGLYTGYATDPEGAVRYLTEGLALIDHQRDPQLTLYAFHNIAWFLVDCGRFRQARNLVWEYRWRYDKHGGHIDQVKLRWLQGLIDVGLGKLVTAEESLFEARKGLGEAGLRYHEALAGLDLASLLLRQERRAEARAVVMEAAGVFLDLNIQREAVGAVLLLQKVFEAGVGARAILDHAIQFLRRIQYDPTLTVKAWFL